GRQRQLGPGAARRHVGGVDLHGAGGPGRAAPVRQQLLLQRLLRQRRAVLSLGAAVHGHLLHPPVVQLRLPGRGSPAPHHRASPPPAPPRSWKARATTPSPTPTPSPWPTPRPAT